MSTPVSTASPLRAGPAQWLGLGVLLLPTMLLFLTLTVLFLATPHIAADLRPSSAQLLWINDIYGFMMAGFLVTMGTLGDRLGRRRLLVLGAAAFGIASLLAAYAPTTGLLIAARAVMGLGAAAVMPSTLSLIITMFRDDKQRATAIGVWAASVSAGVALGPLVGGALLDTFWWGSALLVGVPVMALVLVTAPVLLPEYRAPQAGRIDLPSVGLSLLSLLPIVYAIKEFAKDGLTPVSALGLTIGIGFGVLFVRRQLRLPDPLLDVRLFTNRVFSGALTVFLLATIALGGVYLLFTQYLQLVAGLSSLEAGLLILPAALALVLVSTITPVIARRIRPAYVIATGLAVSAVGYLVLTQVGSVSGLGLLIAGFFILYPGIAPAMALVPNLVISSAPPEKAGAASAVNSTASDLGLSLGIAILGSIGTAVYRSQVSGGLPAGTPAEIAADASDSLPGALTAAEEATPEVAEALLAPAREAFTVGLNVTSGVAAAVVAGAAVLTVALLRHIRPAHPEPTEIAGERQSGGPEPTPEPADLQPAAR